MRFPLIYLLVFLLTSILVPAQNKHKVMVIPFEPKMYMSQIDHRINAETHLTQRQIREQFRKGLNEEMTRAFKRDFEVVDLYRDTSKYKKEILLVYKNLSYSYDKVPDQSNYKAPEKEKEKNQNIRNGQLVVETDPNARFMNAKITSATLVPSLYAKFKTDLYVFINELEITSAGIMNETGMVSERLCTVHYTVYTVNARELNSGICSLKFPSDVNAPSKISTSYFSKIASEIERRVRVLLDKEEKVKEEKK